MAATNLLIHVQCLFLQPRLSYGATENSYSALNGVGPTHCAKTQKLLQSTTLCWNSNCF